MVIRTEHIDAAVESSRTLVLVVGNVSGNVCGVAVTLDDYAIAIITESCGAKPNSAVLFEDVAHLAQTLNGALNCLGFIE